MTAVPDSQPDRPALEPVTTRCRELNLDGLDLPEPSVPERLANAAFHLEEARRHCLEASSALSFCDLIPVEFQRDILFTMDACRDRLVEIADFSANLGSRS